MANVPVVHDSSYGRIETMAGAEGVQLADSDATIVGSGTRYGRMASQMADLR